MRRRRIRKRIRSMLRFMRMFMFVFVTLMCLWMLLVKSKEEEIIFCEKIPLGNVEVIERFLTVNEYSRPGTPLESVTGIVIHYTGNPGTTAEGNRSYFQSLAYDKTTSASSHFIVDLEGEIIQCIPLDEQAYATRGRNADTIGIEVCHPDEDGEFNSITYESVVELTVELCKKYGLTEDDVIRHYDVTGKICPRYYVLNEDAWDAMRNEIGLRLEQTKEE